MIDDQAIEAWRIEPMRGLGALTFGLSPADVAALANVYGSPSPLMSQAHVADDVEKVFAELGLADAISAEDLAAIRSAAAGQAGLSTQTLFGDGPTLLEFEADRLSCVMVEPACGPVTFRGQVVFDMSAQDALRMFEAANGGPGRYRSTEAAFDALAVSLTGFSATSRDGSIRLARSEDEDFLGRSIAVRHAPYRPESEVGQFVTHSVL